MARSKSRKGDLEALPSTRGRFIGRVRCCRRNCKATLLGPIADNPEKAKENVRWFAAGQKWDTCQGQGPSTCPTHSPPPLIDIS